MILADWSELGPTMAIVPHGEVTTATSRVCAPHWSRRGSVDLLRRQRLLGPGLDVLGGSRDEAIGSQASCDVRCLLGVGEFAGSCHTLILACAHSGGKARHMVAQGKTFEIRELRMVDMVLVIFDL
jgi:hypothetical protein